MALQRQSWRRGYNTYYGWMRRIVEFKGGLIEHVIVLMTLVVTIVCSWYGIGLFPPGRYPQILLAAPGLLCGGLFFWLTTYVYWHYIKE